MNELTDVQRFYLATLKVAEQAILNGDYKLAIRELSGCLRALKQEKLTMDKYQ